MLLKRLSLVGFKSFADRTRLEFDAGVNVVVGPNGSGKSNLLDAIAWVMGTQATRVLRTQRMEDVVFAGTTTRPPLSRAEVSLTFDNADGFLPLDLAEITITRRLFRDGTSEYELNGASCRLLDIQELLADGGVGRRQHVLVGQGQIGEILSARPDEHRAVIEEAAGITKHRSRRDRAMRRLEHTEGDVARLEDLLAEKRRRLRPLRRQAAAAARRDAVRTEARELRLWLGGRELRELRERARSAAVEHGELERRLTADREEEARLAGALGELRGTAREVGEALRRDTAAAARLETVAERLRRIGLVARERRRSLESRLHGVDERRADLEGEEAELGAALGALAAQEREARVTVERAEAALQELEDEERSLAEQVRLPAEGLVATLRGELHALRTAAERDGREEAALGARGAVVRTRIEEDVAEAAALNEAIRETDGAVTGAQAEYEAARRRRTDAQRVWEERSEAATRVEIAVAGAAARLEALETAVAGLADPEARRRVEDASGLVGAVVALLDVPAEVAAAVDAALGPWSDAFVMAGREELREVVAALKHDGLGGVAAVAPTSAGEIPARRVAADTGVEALVDRLGSGADPIVAAALLGDVVLVEGWGTAWELSERYPHLRVVTPEGDLFGVRGVTVAAPDGAGPAALEAARVALERTERERSRQTSLLATARRDFDRARDRERVALERLEGLEARLAGLSEALGLVERSRGEHEAELRRLEERLQAIEEARTVREERIAGLGARLAELEGEEAVRQAAWEALELRRREVARRRDEARRTKEEAAAELAGVLERRRMSERRLEAVRAEGARLASRPAADARIGRLRGIEEVAGRALQVVSRHLEALRGRQRDLRERAATAERRLVDGEARRRELGRRIEEAKDRLAVLGVEMAELRVREEAVAEGLRRDVDASEEEALAAPAPTWPEGITPQERLAALEADLRRMGPVNPLAAAEYETIAAEVEELETQLADLEASRRELRKVIAALDEEMAAAFLEAFREIAARYEEHFALVFPGGRGRLRLTDPDHPLETGVEVEAQPAGKKVGRLTLLSGGERSLAALAFLFAVFRARPSPFYVLDEVEAALDDANLRRFLRLIDLLRDSAQLVIITHQQQTMEAADILYGVTMEPGASSRVIAKRLSTI